MNGNPFACGAKHQKSSSGFECRWGRNKRMTNTYMIRRVPGAKPDWQQIEPLYIRHYLWMENTYQPRVEIKVCYTDAALHVQYKVFEQDPTIRYLQMNQPVHKDSCVEFFVQPSPETDERYL